MFVACAYKRGLDLPLIVLLVDGELGKRLERAIEIARGFAQDSSGVFAMGERGQRAFVARMQALLQNKGPELCGTHKSGAILTAVARAARDAQDTACVARQMHLEYGLIVEAVRTFGLVVRPKDELLRKAEGDNKDVETPIKSSWRVWDALAQKIAAATLEGMLGDYKANRPVRGPATDELQAGVAKAHKIRAEALTDALKLNTALTHAQIVEIVKGSYETDRKTLPTVDPKDELKGVFPGIERPVNLDALLEGAVLS